MAVRLIVWLGCVWACQSMAAIVAHFHFDERDGATTFLESSFTSNNGTCSGGTCPAAGEQGVLSSAVRFDGTTDVIVVNDHDSLDNTANLTIQAWIFPTVVNGAPDGIVSKRVSFSSNNSYSLFYYTGGLVNCDIVGSGDRQASATALSANRWYHLTMTYDGSEPAATRGRLYINGVLDGNSPFNESSSSIPNNASNVTIGMLNAGYGQGIHGLLDEVIIYDETLTDFDVRSTYLASSWRFRSRFAALSGILPKAMSPFLWN